MVPFYLPAEDQWVFPPLEEALEKTRLLLIGQYVKAHQSTLVEHIATRPILNLCFELERESGSTSEVACGGGHNLVSVNCLTKQSM